MIFLAPIAGLVAGGVGVATVVVMYMLKLGRRPVAVSSTLMWARAVKDMEGNIPWQRLSPTVLLWLHMLIVVLLALAIARPVLDVDSDRGGRVYLVIDTSASMNAVDRGSGDRRTGLERAKAQAIERVSVLFDSGQSPMVSVVVAGLEPKIVLTDSSRRGQLIRVIQSIQASDQPGDVHDAIALIESISEARADEDEAMQAIDARVLVFSDGGSVKEGRIAMRSGNGVMISPFDDQESSGLGNLGIVAIGGARDRSDPVMSRVFVRVERNADGPRGAVIRVMAGAGEDGEIDRRAVAFDEGVDSVSETFELRLMQGMLVRVELEVDDALEADNQAWVKMPAPSLVRLVVVAPDGQADPLLVDMLEVIVRSRVVVIEPGEQIHDADMVVYDRVTPKVWPTVPSLGFGCGFSDQVGDLRLDVLGARRRMISWDRRDPIVRESGLGSVSYQRSVRFVQDDSTRALAWDGDGAVIVERVAGKDRHVRVGFALHDSNWAVQVGLPIFLINVVEQLLPGTSGVGRVYTTSDLIDQGDEIAGDEVVGVIDRIGVVDMKAGAIGVSLLDADESALDGRTGVAIGSEGAALSQDHAASDQGGQSLWRWFTLIAVVLVGVEWFVYASRLRIV